MSGTWESFDWPNGEFPIGRAGKEELEQLRLVALEQALADARRLLAHAGGILAPRHLRAETIALAGLAADLHRAVARELARG